MLEEANHTYNFGSGSGKSSAVSIAKTLDCLKKSLKHAESGCSSLIQSLHEILEL